MRGGSNPPSLEGDTGDLPQKFFKIFVSENAFQAILKPFFPYSITSILSKVRHSNPRGVLQYFRTYVGSGYLFWVQNFEFQFLGGFQKNENSLGMKILCMLLWGHHKIGLYLEVISMHFRVFS